MKDQWGGGILNRKNPKGLQRFNKNKKQKRILIGSIIGIVLIVGGISLYRSFAMYKEEKTFDVLNGTVPDFVYKEKILNGTDPVLKSSTGAKLIPVTIDENDGTVRKADIKDEWYSYEKKEWANAVILVDDTKEYKNDEEIPEEEIESYFVWIPKYKYKIFDMGNTYTTVEKEGTELEDKGSTTVIDIEFGLTDTTDDETKKECKTPNASGEDGTCDVNKWMTHPAFTAFENSKGFWVGKFETGYNQSKEENPKTISVDNSWTEPNAQKNENAPAKVIIKPNVYSWRGINVGNAYKTSYDYQRELDSHLMKNTEWGAVAYLTNSKYGRCNNEICEEIRINNSSNYVTGVAAINLPVGGFAVYNDYGTVTLGEDVNENGNFKGAYNYKNKLSNIASTTGNYTGIYDMSGDSWEFVMGAATSATSAKEVSLENMQLDSSGLTKGDIKDQKYIDLYINGVNTQYNRRILGDATGEMGPFELAQYSRILGSWYNDQSSLVTKDASLIRGGSHAQGTEGGIFEFGGGAMVRQDFSFRIVLTP